RSAFVSAVYDISDRAVWLAPPDREVLGLVIGHAIGAWHRDRRLANREAAATVCRTFGVDGVPLPLCLGGWGFEHSRLYRCGADNNFTGSRQGHPIGCGKRSESFWGAFHVRHPCKIVVCLK